MVCLLKFTGLGIYVLIIGNVTFPIVVSILNLLALRRYIPSLRLKPLKTFFVPLSASLWMSIAVVLVYTLSDKLFSSFLGGYMANAVSVILALLTAVIVYFVVFLKLRGMTKEEMFDFPMGRRLYLMAVKLKLMK